MRYRKLVKDDPTITVSYSLVSKKYAPMVTFSASSPGIFKTCKLIGVKIDTSYIYFKPLESETEVPDGYIPLNIHYPTTNISKCYLRPVLYKTNILSETYDTVYTGKYVCHYDDVNDNYYIAVAEKQPLVEYKTRNKKPTTNISTCNTNNLEVSKTLLDVLESDLSGTDLVLLQQVRKLLNV